jgi:hypothetical protein
MDKWRIDAFGRRSMAALVRAPGCVDGSSVHLLEKEFSCRLNGLVFPCILPALALTCPLQEFQKGLPR